MMAMENQLELKPYQPSSAFALSGFPRGRGKGVAPAHSSRARCQSYPWNEVINVFFFNFFKGNATRNSCWFFLINLSTSHKLEESENLESATESQRLKTTLHLVWISWWICAVDWLQTRSLTSFLHTPVPACLQSTVGAEFWWFQTSSGRKSKSIWRWKSDWNGNLIMCSAQRKRASMEGSKCERHEQLLCMSGCMCGCAERRETWQLSVFI